MNRNNGGCEQTWAIPSLSDPQWAPRNEQLYSSETGLSWKTGGVRRPSGWPCGGAASGVEAHRRHNAKTQCLAVSVTGIHRTRIA